MKRSLHYRQTNSVASFMYDIEIRVDCFCIGDNNIAFVKHSVVYSGGALSRGPFLAFEMYLFNVNLSLRGKLIMLYFLETS